MKHFKILVPLIFLMAIQYFYFEYQLERFSQQATQISSQQNQQVQTFIQLPEFSRLAESAKDSVVSIDVFNSDSDRRFDGMGSGFIISEDGYLLTNFHVTHGARRLEVKLANGSEFDAEVIGSDPETDLSLIKIDATGLMPFEFGSVDDTKVGSWVVAIGAPFGLEQTVTAGIVSAKGRSVGEQYVPYIQTDAAVNVGNSGGPLINMQGKVIGVNSKIFSTDGGSVGLSFAIPIDLAADVIEQLKTEGRVSRGFLGVRYQAVTKNIAENYSLPQNRGALINEVTKNSPADRGGLEAGDIVSAVNGKPIINHTELPFLIGRIRPGMQAALSVIRDGKQEMIEIVVGSREPEGLVALHNPPLPYKASNLLAAEVVSLNEDIRNSLDLDAGVLVRKISDGPALKAGIGEGDIILAIQTTPIKTVSDFETELERVSGLAAFTILILKPGEVARNVFIELDQEDNINR